MLAIDPDNPGGEMGLPGAFGGLSSIYAASFKNSIVNKRTFCGSHSVWRQVRDLCINLQ